MSKLPMRTYTTGQRVRFKRTDGPEIEAVLFVRDETYHCFTAYFNHESSGWLVKTSGSGNREFAAKHGMMFGWNFDQRPNGTLADDVELCEPIGAIYPVKQRFLNLPKPKENKIKLLKSKLYLRVSTI